MDFLVVLRRAQCIQPVITIPPGPDYWAYAMTYGFKRMKSLSRISSLCCFGNIRADTCNKIAVVWRWKKRLRRKIEEFSGFGMQSSLRRIHAGWGALVVFGERFMKVHLSLWKKALVVVPWCCRGAVCFSWEPPDCSDRSEVLQVLTLWSISEQTHLLNVVCFTTLLG